MKVDSLIKEIYEIVEPLSNELNLELYHIEYVKENGEYYLRIYIDKDGGIFLSDCEALSRRVSDVLDEVDPIKDAYFLEVSSPGLNRRLFTDAHYEKFIEREVLVRLTKALEGNKNFKGILKEVKDDSIIVEIESDKLQIISKDKIKSTNLDGEI